MFQSLLQLDFYSGKLVPVLVEQVPNKVDLDNGAYRYDFVIREEAQWDDGKAVNAEDVLFSLKLFFNPILDNGIRRQYLEPISNIEIDEYDKRKFSIYFEEPYIQALWCLVDLKIVDKRLFDPEGVYDQWSLSDLHQYAEYYPLHKDSLLEVEFLTLTRHLIKLFILN